MNADHEFDVALSAHTKPGIKVAPISELISLLRDPIARIAVVTIFLNLVCIAFLVW